MPGSACSFRRFFCCGAGSPDVRIRVNGDRQTMIFNLGAHEALIIGLVALFFVGLPVVAWFLARRGRRQETGRRPESERRS